MKKALVILPTINEFGTIQEVIDGIFESVKNNPDWEMHVLVVDSESKDNTVAIVKKLQSKNKCLYLLQTKKEGLGKAYVQGFSFAFDRLNPFVIFEMDSDMSHDPKKIPEFLDQIEKGADFVIGTRYIKNGSIPKNWGLHRKVFSVTANIFVRLGFMNLKISDWTSGYRAIKSWILKSSMSHVTDFTGYVFQIALLDHAIQQGAVIREIPIHFKDRETGISKINSLQYIIHTFLYVLTHSSFIKFTIVGGIGFIIDFGLSYILIEKGHRALWFATLISTEAAIISNFLLNNFWSFAHKRIDDGKRSLVFNFLKFNLVSSGSIGIQTFGIHLCEILFGRKFWYIYKIFIICFIVIPYSYFFYNKFIWKDRSKK